MVSHVRYQAFLILFDTVIGRCKRPEAQNNAVDDCHAIHIAEMYACNVLPFLSTMDII